MVMGVPRISITKNLVMEAVLKEQIVYGVFV